MPRLHHHCVLSVCLAGALLLLQLCWAGKEDQYEYDYEATQTPDYDYNATFDFTFFSNTSNIEDLEKFLNRGETEDGEETETERTVVAKTTTPAVFSIDEASRTASPSLLLTLGLLTLGLTAHLLDQLL